jgi:hypothetical protein
VFCIGWFIAAIAPVLPLRNHRSDYYVMIPVIGLAILAGAGIASAWRSRTGRVASLIVVAAYWIPGVWMANGMTKIFRAHADRVKHTVRGVADAARQHPDKVLLISGVDTELFWRTWYDGAFRALGIQHIYLPERATGEIRRIRENAGINHFFIADTIALHLLEKGKARAYRVLPDGHLRDGTGLMLARLQRMPLAGPEYLDARSPLSAVHMKDGWWPAEANHRWMSGHASVELRGPKGRMGELVLSGFCTPEHVRSGPLRLMVAVNGIALPSGTITASNLHFRLRVALPAAVSFQPLMRVELKVDRPLVLPGDGRELGAAFGTFKVVP